MSQLPAPDVRLPIDGGAFVRPDPALLERLRAVSSATASAQLHRLGIRQTYIAGPEPRVPGARVVGPVVTLQFMPQREDVASGQAQEGVEKRSALWAVFETVQPGDILAIAAHGDPYTGCVGEMLATYFQGRGGIGMVIDGRIRDWPKIRELNLPLWTRGVTPNYASQAGLFPWAFNVPVALSRVLVLPGDIMIADDDGAVIVPARVAALLAEQAGEHEEWEVFSRLKLAEGGALQKYYPLNDEGRAEYEQWRAAQS
jgi:regulator of RNase E activity RraA